LFGAFLHSFLGDLPFGYFVHPVQSIFARSLGCSYTGGNMSALTTCDTVYYSGGGERRLAEQTEEAKVVLKDNSGYRQPRLHRQHFYGKNCNGQFAYDEYLYYNDCDGGGMSTQCVANQNTLGFIKKDGLVT
jgi:hypothetical protein